MGEGRREDGGWRMENACGKIAGSWKGQAEWAMLAVAVKRASIGVC
jgi:hypothetical protein